MKILIYENVPEISDSRANTLRRGEVKVQDKICFDYQGFGYVSDRQQHLVPIGSNSYHLHASFIIRSGPS